MTEPKKLGPDAVVTWLSGLILNDEDRRRCLQLLLQRWPDGLPEHLNEEINAEMYRAFPQWWGKNIGELSFAQRYPLIRDALAHEQSKEPQTPGAVWIGNRRVRIGNDSPFTIPQQYAVVLEALVDLGAADSKQLERSGGGAKKLRDLLKKFPELKPFIELPGRKGKGGYRTTIRDSR